LTWLVFVKSLVAGHGMLRGPAPHRQCPSPGQGAEVAGLRSCCGGCPPQLAGTVSSEDSTAPAVHRPGHAIAPTIGSWCWRGARDDTCVVMTVFISYLQSRAHASRRLQ